MLSLGVSTGSKIKIGDSVLEVMKIVSPHLILVSVNGGEVIAISNQKKEEILPGVYIQTGAVDNASGHRLAFDADRSVVIGRVREN